MNQSPIFEALQPSGAIFGIYSGVETASRFTSIQEELSAFTSGCAIYDLNWRAKLSVRGEDRTRWLNGMATNNIKGLPVNLGNYNFVLNPQGRILGDLYAYNLGETLLLDTDRSQAEPLKAIFDHYIIMDDVEIEDVSEKIFSIGLQGAAVGDVLKKIGLEFAALEPGQVNKIAWQQAELSLVRTPRTESEAYELWISSPAEATQLWQSLRNAGATPAGTDSLEAFRILLGVPKYGIDIRDRDLPQETRQDLALNFTKGCYIGQEIVERIRSRGAVHRQFTGFKVEGELPEAGTKVLAEDKEVGEITSITTLPSGSPRQIIALGYIRREAIDKGLELTYAGGKLMVSQLPFSLP